jgi:hypothetical protein
MSRPRTPAPPAVRTLTAVLLALVLALVAGCGLRLETPPPAPLTPDVDEQARQRAAEDAVALGALAGPAPEPAPDPAADPLGAARAAVATEASTHLELLGGLYDPGTPPPDPDAGSRPTPTAEPSPTTGTVEALLARLTDASATARADAGTVRDGALARLLGSVSVGRLLSAARLAGAAGLPPPPVPDVTPPDAAPAGLSPADLSTIVAAEDAAGYGYEVIAAKHGDDVRARAGARAATHRARAQAWAEAGGLDGTGLDPRRVAYAVPGGLEDPAAAAALARSLESTLAASYASAVATVDPGARAAMLDAVAEATAQAVAWGSPLPALPGLPERTGG